MTRYDYSLSAEDYPPEELVRQARPAQEAGFDGLWISDHFHPCLGEQGESGFVWSDTCACSRTPTSSGSTVSPAPWTGRSRAG